MIKKSGESGVFYFEFTNKSTGIGLTGLSPTGKYRKISDGTEGTLTITELDATDFPGIYTAPFTSDGDISDYLGHAHTTSTQAMKRDVYSFWTAGSAGVNNLDTPVSDIPNDVLEELVEPSWSFREYLITIGGTTAGKVSGAGTGTETFRNIGDTNDVAIVSADDDGNRTAITYDPTP